MLQIVQTGCCAGPGCSRPLTEANEHQVYLTWAHGVLGFCSQPCFRRRMRALLTGPALDRSLSQADALATLGYDPDQPQPALEAEGPPPEPRQKKQQ
jgi:hypothetical protein